MTVLIFPDSIKNDIITLTTISKVFFGVINDLISPQRSYQFRIHGIGYVVSGILVIQGS